MRFNVVTLFPSFFTSPLAVGVTGQALRRGLVELQTVNPRDFTEDVHKTVDDRPFGGGDGMVMLVEPLRRAVESIQRPSKIVYLSPHGKPWSDVTAREWAASGEDITLICGRYSGVDQRFINAHVDEEVSVGDFVLSGGEPAVLCIVDSVARHVPGVLGNPDSPVVESFADGHLEHPQFTRPREYEGQAVPEILFGGHHAQIVNWQKDMGLVFTAVRRPDLVIKNGLQGKTKEAVRRALLLSDADLSVCGIDKNALQDWLSENEESRHE